MPTTDVQQKPKDVVTPMLIGNIPASQGHYAVTHTWEVDSTTLLPINVRQSVDLGTSGVGD